MSTIFEDLKSAREAKNISLEDIADITLINVQLLRAIEQGDTTILPQTYVRAFLREYAGVVGLDKDEIMKRYDSGAAPPAVESAPLLNQAEPMTPGFVPGLVRVGIGAIVAVAAIFGLWSAINSTPPPAPAEIPFQNILKEAENRVASTKNIEPKLPQGAPGDSLTLRAATTDTVWVHIVIDDQAPREYLFRPKGGALWRASRRFSFTAGNAGAITLRLNNKDLGPAGKRGAVVRNLELTRESLR